MEAKKFDLKSIFFIVFLILLGLLMWQIVVPFASVVLIAIVIVEVLHPLYRLLRKIFGNEAVASILSTLTAILVVIVPVIIISLLIISEISKITETRNIPQWIALTEDAIHTLVTSVNSILSGLGVPLANQITTPNLQLITNAFLAQIETSFLPITTSIISVSLNTLFYLFLLIVTLLYTFVAYENLPKAISRISPLDDKLDGILFKKFTETIRAVLKGNFLVAIAQASAVSAMLLIMDVGAPVLLWLIMVLLSLIPVGSGLVWFPVGLVMIFSGRPIEGILLIVYSAIIINVIDTLLRPYLIKNTIQLHPLIIIFSVIGGIITFNSPLGIFYGPLIAVFFTSMMEVYNQHFANTVILEHEKAS